MSELKERPVFNFNFHGNVGQQIGNVEHMEVHFDKDMQMQVSNVEEMSGADIKTAGGAAPQEKPLNIVVGKTIRQKLDIAEEAGIIAYNPERKGYDKGLLASKALVAYLCGKIFCGDYTDKGYWMEGKRFEDAKLCEQLFGFDVAATRRSVRGNGAGNPPIGYEKIDKLYHN